MDSPDLNCLQKAESGGLTFHELAGLYIIHRPGMPFEL